MWGRTYERVLSEIPADRITARKPGEWIQIKQGTLVCRYSFYQRRRIKAVHTVPSTPGGRAAGRPRRLMSPPMPVVEYEPIDPPEQARLFAVTIHYGSMAMEARYKNTIEKVLTDTYGRIMNRTRSHYDLENNVTFIRAYLETYRKHDYLKRLVFSSKELSREMKADRRQLEAEATERLKTAMSAPPPARSMAASPDVNLEASESYMEPAGESSARPAAMQQTMTPVAEEIQAESEVVPETDSVESGSLATEEPLLDVTPPPTPGGLQSEALPADFMGGDDVQNPFELP